MGDLGALNQLARDLYEAQDPTVRQRAERQLADFKQSAECPEACLALLQQGDLPYAPVVACTTLLSYVSSWKCTMPDDQRLYLSQCLLNFLAERARTLPQFALTAVFHLLARVTKVGWSYRNPTADEDMEDEAAFPFRTPIWQLIEQLSVDRLEESELALQIINKLVEDFNSVDGFDPLAKFRKDLNIFRDGILEKIFALSLRFLREYVVDAQTVREDLLPLLNKIMDLALNCASFNFLAVTDELSEEANVHFPNEWKTCFLDGRPSDMILPMYSKLPTAFTERVLHFAVQITAARRQLYTAVERQEQLKHMIAAIMYIVENCGNLNDSGAFHQFCRLVLRMKVSYHSSELEKNENYLDFIRCLGNFTVQSFNMPQLSQNSIYYLIHFWSKMAGSASSSRDIMFELIPEIFKTYLESRLKNVELVALGDLDDPLDEQHTIVCVMEQIATICRVDYEKTFDWILGHFEGNVRVLQSTSENRIAAVAKERLAWLALFAGAGVFGGTTPPCGQTPPEHEKMDGRLAGNCINLMRLSDQALFSQGTPTTVPPPNGNRHLETAFIFFIDCFRKAYITAGVSVGMLRYSSRGESGRSKISPVYETFAQEAQITNERDLLAFVSGKLSSNLKFWGLDEELLELTLDLFQELTQRYESLRELLKSQEMQELVQNHADFPFLSTELSFAAMKRRTKFYVAITRMFFVDAEEEVEVQAFEVFFQPFKDRIFFITSVLDGERTATEEQMQRLMVALFRDMRGVMMAATTKTSVCLILDLVYPDLFKIIAKCVAEWPAVPEVIIPAFRLLQEVMLNHHDRYRTDGTFCAGNYLFRHLATVIASYTESYAQLSRLPESEMYNQRYKLIGSLFVALKNSLSGGHVSFGVFQMYDDDSWEKALRCAMRLATSITETALMSHSKFAKTYFNMMEGIVRSNMAFISRLDQETFVFILGSLRLGAFNRWTSAVPAAVSMEHIMDYLFRRTSVPAKKSIWNGTGPEGDECLRAVEARPDILADITRLIFHQLLHEHLGSTATLSPCLLSLIFIQPDVYASITAHEISKMPERQRADAQEAFAKLMNGVKKNVSPANKEKFVFNVSKFLRDLDYIKKDLAGGLNRHAHFFREFN